MTEFPKSLRLKLVIPRSEEECHELHKSCLLQVFTELRFRINSPFLIEINEPGCSSFLEFNYEVTPSRTNHLMLAMKMFYQRLKKQNIPPESMGTVSFHSLDWFTQEIKTHHLNEPLGAINFGNILEGVFLDHWEVSFDSVTQDKKRKREDKISVDFEYDRTDMIVVNFDNNVKERRNQHSNQMRNGVRKYFLQIQSSFIQRIIVDPDVCDDGYGARRYRLYLELNAPPMIREAFVEADRQRHGHNTAVRQRVTIMKRGTDQRRLNNGELVDQKPKDAAIAESPYFAMEFFHTVEEKLIYEIISRLRVRTGVPVEFTSVSMSECRIGPSNPYFHWLCGSAYPDPIVPPTLLRQPEDDKKEGAPNFGAVSKFPSPLDEREPIYGGFLNKHFPIDNIARAEDSRHFHNRFAIRYLIECLMSRGSVVKDQLWLEKSKWTSFLELISEGIAQDFAACETALEKLIVLIDERKRISSLHKAFQEVLRQVIREKMQITLSDQLIREGFQRVRKIVFTPTRVIYSVPEILMSNRVIRDYDQEGNRILRVVFRDDDGSRMSASKTSDMVIERTVRKYLLDGVIIAGRSFGYLGSSNSQLREFGAYIMVKAIEEHIREYFKENMDAKMVPQSFRRTIHVTRAQLGRFMEIKSVSKMMARLGQCFTQTREVQVPLHVYSSQTDVIGGSDSNGSHYTFSDGVGTVSESYMRDIAKALGFKVSAAEGSRGKIYPSTIQFRYRGLKGVLSVDKILLEYSNHAKEHNFEPLIPFRKQRGKGTHIDLREIQCFFRSSQEKFVGSMQDFLEIVKFSTPVPVAFNKPFLNIMDQVSEMQSKACHQRITNRIEELLDNQLRGYAKMMIEENSCRNRLKELPARIDIDLLSTAAGFSLCSEPFFRSLVKASVKFAITKQLKKQQINIPSHLGRSMLGIVDESGLLQYGQVFVQYTKNIGTKKPRSNAKSTILTGTVLITKNPCIVEGDVRIFEAVDLECLRHLCDVVVFPQHGPRPHPDQMAGSDLDGDEYSVIWDKQLLLDYNMPAFDFTAEKQKEVTLTEETMDAEMIKFYTNYLTQDSVGTISTNFLCCSDLYGISSRVCQNLAKKNSQALDFTKSGKPPAPLTTKWSFDESGEAIPPEKAERFPDFHITDNVKPVYESHKLIGRLHREIRIVEDVVRLSEDLDEQMDIKVDDLLLCDGWEKYANVADEQLSRYNAILRTIMENYGIKSEAEIFSGCICDMRNKISDKDKLDPYNTNQVLETRISELFSEFRADFFEEFGGWMNCTEVVENGYADENNVCQRRCVNVTKDMSSKASAYYRQCYTRCQQTRERKLSFAWVVYDILYEVRKTNALLNPEFHVPASPLFTALNVHNKQFIEENQAEADEFFGIPSRIFGNATEILKKYCKKYGGIERVFFLICQWARKCQLMKGGLSDRQICLIFILHATNTLASVDGNYNAVIDLIPRSTELSEIEAGECPTITQPAVLLRFFEYLSSRSFAKLKSLSFVPVGYLSLFNRGEWVNLHKCAIKTYHNLVFNLRFEELPLSTDTDLRTDLISREAQPFAIELPSGLNWDEIAKLRVKMIEKTGVRDIAMRKQMGFLQLSNNSTKTREKYSVIARGTIEALDRLRNLLAVHPRNHSIQQAKEMSQLMPQITFYQIMGYWFQPPEPEVSEE